MTDEATVSEAEARRREREAFVQGRCAPRLTMGVSLADVMRESEAFYPDPPSRPLGDEKLVFGPDSPTEEVEVDE